MFKLMNILLFNNSISLITIIKLIVVICNKVITITEKLLSLLLIPYIQLILLITITITNTLLIISIYILTLL